LKTKLPNMTSIMPNTWSPLDAKSPDWFAVAEPFYRVGSVVISQEDSLGQVQTRQKARYVVVVGWEGLA